MALYAFDGTWNADEEAPQEDTNVVRFRDIYAGPVEYRAGVGTRFGSIGRMLGGIFGVGGRSRTEEMYEALQSNWQQGDHTIDIIGFSRGAALAVHFANVIAEAGIKLNDGQVAQPTIRFLGVWDVVASFGIPIDLIIEFQDINVGWHIERIPGAVQHCFHAMALDERRQTFEVTRLNPAHDKPNVEECWFRGVHSDVGGGNGNVARSNIALRWMLEKAEHSGLPIAAAAIGMVGAGADPMAPVFENKDPIRGPRRIVLPGDPIHPTALPKTLAVGEQASFPVRAAYKYNWTGVRLQAGGQYRFDIAENQKWMDGGITCGPDGWRSEDLPWYKESIVKWFDDNKRCRDANWFELIGSVDDEGDTFFRIGTGGQDRVFQATRDADLYAFANDLDAKYDNNEGSLTVTVTRTA